MAAEASTFLRVACGGCGKTLRVPAKLAGRTVKCPQCGAAFPVSIPAPEPAAAEAPAEAPPPPPAPRSVPGAPKAPPSVRPGSRSRLRSRARPAGEQEAAAEGGAPKKGIPWWIKWPAGIVFVILCGYVVVSFDERSLEREKAECHAQAISTLAEGAKDLALARFLIDKFHEDCCQKALVEVRASRRSKRWACDAGAYMAAMKGRLEAELANPNSTLVREFRAQRGS